MDERALLERECAVFCRYLSDAPPSAYIRAKYVEAHAVGVLEWERASSFERAVVALARNSPWLTRAMDSHERVFANGSLLRRKLVLVLALLETRAPEADELDAPTPGSRAGMLLRMAWLAAAFAARATVTAVVLLPVRLGCFARGSR
jgi:hypothetical protein